MKTNFLLFLTPRTILAVLCGIAASILLMVFLANDMLAAVLGAMITFVVASPRQPVEMALLGLVTGSLSGIYWGVAGLLAEGGADQAFSAGRWALAVIGGWVLVGLLCAFYGFLTGKFFQLYQKGRGPFF